MFHRNRHPAPRARRFHPRAHALACAIAALLPLAAHAADDSDTADTLDGIVVTASRQPTRIDQVLSDITVISRDEIEANIGATVSDLLSRQPGIQMARNGGPGTATSFFVRGTNSPQTKVLVDGVAINSLDASGSALPNIALADVDHIEIVRGPASTLYGADAIGGVIQIFTRQGEQGVHADGFAGIGTRGTSQANAGVSAGGEHWRLRVGANHQYSDGISSLEKSQVTGHDRDDDAYRNNGGDVAFSVLPAQGHEIGVNWRENKGYAAYDDGYDPTDNNHELFLQSQWQAFARDQFTSNWHSTVQYGEAREDQHDFDNYGGGRISTTNKQASWQNDIDLPLGRLLLAAEYLDQEGEDYGPLDSMHIDSLLAGWNAHLGASSWQLNVRNDDHSTFGDKNTFGLAYGYQFTSHWRVQASYGSAFKAPSLYQLYAPLYGNTALRPEFAHNGELALHWNDGVQDASITAYRNRVNDMIDWVVTDPVTYAGQYVNVNRAQLQGVTLAYGLRFDAWTLDASYDYLDAKDEDSGLRLGRRARNSVKVSGAYHWSRFELGAEVVSAGSRFDTNTENDAANALGGYALVNLHAAWRFSDALSLEARVDNLFDKDYELAKGYSTPGIGGFLGLRYAPR